MKTIAKRHFEISKTASNLIISLNRFDYKTSGNLKIMSLVEIPNVLIINQQKLFL